MAPYPHGVSVSMNVRLSGHRLADGRMAVLCEAQAATHVEPESQRSVQALLRMAVMISLCGQIGRQGEQVFEATVWQPLAWARAGQDLVVSVNVWARQLRQPDLLPSLLQVLAGQDAALMPLLRAIEATGLCVALDDFGAGTSKLACLQRFPIQTLKIDKAFIQGIEWWQGNLFARPLPPDAFTAQLPKSVPPPTAA